MEVHPFTGDLTEAILARRSIRTGYVREPLSIDVLDRIVLAGLSAPSSKNAQSWRFHVITDGHTLDHIASLILAAEDKDSFVPSDPKTGSPRATYDSSVRESAHVLQHVPAAIMVENLGRFSYNRRTLAQTEPQFMDNALLGFALEMVGIGAAIENMWLAATSLGLGAVFMGDVLIVEDSIKRLLDVQGDIIGALALGHSSAMDVGPRRLKDGRVTHVDAGVARGA